MKVVDLKTMKAYCVPLRDIVEGGLRQKNLKYFSECEREFILSHSGYSFEFTINISQS